MSSRPLAAINSRPASIRHHRDPDDGQDQPAEDSGPSLPSSLGRSTRPIEARNRPAARPTRTRTLAMPRLKAASKARPSGRRPRASERMTRATASQQGTSPPARAIGIRPRSGSAWGPSGWWLVLAEAGQVAADPPETNGGDREAGRPRQDQVDLGRSRGSGRPEDRGDQGDAPHVDGRGRQAEQAPREPGRPPAERRRGHYRLAVPRLDRMGRPEYERREQQRGQASRSADRSSNSGEAGGGSRRAWIRSEVGRPTGPRRTAGADDTENNRRRAGGSCAPRRRSVARRGGSGSARRRSAGRRRGPRRPPTGLKARRLVPSLA